VCGALPSVPVFATTFLGHQGWLVQTDRAALLVDPLLCDDFGAAHVLEYKVWPPRAFDFAQFPRLDALILSHEHDDHFDLPSLAKLDRKIPVYMSARSSVAARDVLVDMGFTVHPLPPGSVHRFGDLELAVFAGDHVSTNCSDEWDTLPYLIKSTDGHGSLFSMVDIPLTELHVTWAAAFAMKPGLVTWTNNSLDWSHMASYLKEKVEGTQQCFMRMGMGHKLITQTWGTPAAMITCAGGFAFTGERSWMNARVFCVDTAEVCKQMANVYKKEKFFSGVPGQTWVMRGGKLAEVKPDAGWLRTKPPAEWPSRAKATVEAHDYAPATGRRTLTDGERDRLRGRLQELAAALVGGVLFRSMCSLLDREGEGRRIAFAFVARDGDERHVYEHDMSACAFREVTGCVAEQTYVGVLECWAADLLAVLDGELGPIALTFGRARVWNALPQRLQVPIFEELYHMSHPLRRPATWREVYARLLAPVKDTAPVVFNRE
jgi:hypothetical protein